jgi:hypothetical protein
MYMIAQSIGIFVVIAMPFWILRYAPVAYADVWEFDREGRVISLQISREKYPDNDAYDISTPLRVTVSTRNNGNLADVYRPIAEGVATLHATNPAVAAAGLNAEEFTRLFVALIDQESRFNPMAVSPKGARGLGQLMPETAAALGVRDVFEPIENLRGAARYLVAQLAAFGRADLALAAYNAGPHRVTRYQGIPPFRETKDYVARITRAAGLAAPGTEADAISAAVSIDPPRQQGSVLEWQN